MMRRTQRVYNPKTKRIQIKETPRFKPIAVPKCHTPRCKNKPVEHGKFCQSCIDAQPSPSPDSPL